VTASTVTPGGSVLADQVLQLSDQIGELVAQRVAYTAGVVTSINTGTNTFAADIRQPDGTTTNIAGIRSDPTLMPFVSETVTLALSGPQIIYQPNGVANGGIGTIQLAAPVNTTLNSVATKITTWYQTSAPVGANTGDLWLDTDDGNKLYRYNGATWVLSQDTQIQSALTQAGTAQATADRKVQIFAQTSPPTNPASNIGVGDWWYDTDDGNKAYTWSGSAWVAKPVGTSAMATGAVTDSILQPFLALSTTISGGASASTRIQINASGLTSWLVSGGISTQTGSYATSSGTWQMQGQMKSVGTNGRTVILDGNIDTATGGSQKAVGEAGIVWQNTDANTNRYGQFYHASGIGELSMDSPTYSTTQADGIPRLGCTIKASSKGLFSYSEGDGSHPALMADNLGNNQFGRRGVTASLWSNHNEMHMSNQNASGGGNQVDLNTDGTWACGHSVQAAVYATGNNLVLRGVGATVGANNGAPIGAYTYGGSWFDHWPSGTGGGVYVHGTFGADTKNFIIDHPTDSTRNLVHGCVEGPAAAVQYTGSATLNGAGRATVSLPSYFEALTFTGGRTVHVTLIGAAGQVGADRPTGGQFTIYGPAGGEVDWMVNALRKNADFEVEPLKTDLRPDQDNLPTWVPDPAHPTDRGKGHWQPPDSHQQQHQQQRQAVVSADRVAPHIAHAHRFAAARTAGGGTAGGGTAGGGTAGGDSVIQGITPGQTAQPVPA
jgi:hypothetical protein